MAKSYSSSAILKQLKAGTECACLAVFETCPTPHNMAAIQLIPSHAVLDYSNIFDIRHAYYD